MNHEANASGPRKSTGLATASLVCGIVAYATCILGIFTAIPAIIFGAISLSRIGRSPNVFNGRGRSIAGIILGGLWFVTMPVVALLMAIAVPNFVTARRTTQTNICKANLKQVYGACETAYLEGKYNFTSVADLVKTGCLTTEPKCPVDNSSYILADPRAETLTVKCPNYSPDHPAEL